MWAPVVTVAAVTKASWKAQPPATPQARFTIPLNLFS